MTSRLTGVRAVGFDFGNTLVEYRGVPLSWQPIYSAALADAAQACGHNATENDSSAAEEVLARYNTRLHPREHEVSYRSIFSEILAVWGVSPDGVEAAASAFFAHFQSKAVWFPDAIPVLTELNARGLRCGVLTDLPYGMDPSVVAGQLVPVRHLVGSLVTSTGIGFRKPSPAGYLQMCRELNSAPSETIYVGDEPKDVEGAVRAGIRPVMLARSVASDEVTGAATDASEDGSGTLVLKISSLLGLLDWLPA